MHRGQVIQLRSDTRDRPNARILATYIPLLLVSLLLAFDQPLREMPLAMQSRLLMLMFATVLGIVIWQAPKGIGAATATYLATYGVFHLGLIALIAVYPRLDGLTFMALHAYWLCPDTGRHAANLAVMGALAFGVGCGVMGLLRPPSNRPPHTGVDPLTKQVFLYCGLALTLVFIGLFYLQILQWGVVGASYRELREARDEMGMIPVYSGIAWGLIFLAAAGPSRWQRIGFGVFLLGWSPLAFVMGLRGAVLFPLVTVFVLLAKTRPTRISLTRIVVAAVVLLLLVSAGKTIRAVGIQRLYGAQVAVALDPIMGLAELGGSLHAVEAVIGWIEGGDPYLLGAGYWAAFDHEWLPRLIPGYSPPRLRHDPRVPVISKRGVRGSGWRAFGFSVIADAYYNFGVFGVLAVMFVTGCIIGALDRLPVTPYRQALCGVLFYPFLVQVRNFFLNMPKRIAFGVILVLVANAAAHVLARRAQPSRGTTDARSAAATRLSGLPGEVPPSRRQN